MEQARNAQDANNISRRSSAARVVRAKTENNYAAMKNEQSLLELGARLTVLISNIVCLNAQPAAPTRGSNVPVRLGATYYDHTQSVPQNTSDSQ